MRLAELSIADPPERWEALGFAVEGRVCELGGVSVRLGGEGSGITSWAIDGIDPGIREIDGLPTTPVPAAAAPSRRAHPGGAIGIDHVVIATPDFDRTEQVLEHGRVQPGVGAVVGGQEPVALELHHLAIVARDQLLDQHVVVAQ